MARQFKIMLLVVFFLLGGCVADPQVDAVRNLLVRKLPKHAPLFSLRLLSTPQDKPLQQYFEISREPGGKVALAGTSGVALASALNHYLKYDAGVQINVWWTKQIASLPDDSLPTPTPVNSTSPYTFFNYLNICAFGYSTPFYHWERWQDEIDWMALNGNRDKSVLMLQSESMGTVTSHYRYHNIYIYIYIYCLQLHLEL